MGGRCAVCSLSARPQPGLMRLKAREARICERERRGGQLHRSGLGRRGAQEGEPPSAGWITGDGEFEGGVSCHAAEDGGAGEELAAERAEFGAMRLAEPALERDAQVVGGDGEVAGRFGRPKRAAAQALQPELRAEFPDAVFDVSASVVAPPDFQLGHRGKQVGPQRLDL